MIDFNEVVSSVVTRTEGALAAVIMDNDGITLADYISPERSIDIQTIGIEYTAILSEIRMAAEVLETGRLEELCVRAAGLVLVIRLVNDDYFIALVLTGEGNSGKGRYLARVAAPVVAAEL